MTKTLQWRGKKYVGEDLFDSGTDQNLTATGDWTHPGGTPTIFEDGVGNAYSNTVAAGAINSYYTFTKNGWNRARIVEVVIDKVPNGSGGRAGLVNNYGSDGKHWARMFVHHAGGGNYSVTNGWQKGGLPLGTGVIASGLTLPITLQFVYRDNVLLYYVNGSVAYTQTTADGIYKESSDPAGL